MWLNGLKMVVDVGWDMGHGSGGQTRVGASWRRCMLHGARRGGAAGIGRVWLEKLGIGGSERSRSKLTLNAEQKGEEMQTISRRVDKWLIPRSECYAQGQMRRDVGAPEGTDVCVF